MEQQQHGHNHDPAERETIVWSLMIMFALGLVTLAAVGWLAQARMGRPVAVGTVAAPDPLAALAQGAATSIQHAEAALASGRRAAAAHALDAALRATEVGRHAAIGRNDPFDFAHQQVQHARRALQNGRPVEARHALRKVPLMLHGYGGRIARPASLSDYEGGVVLNPRGVRLGEIDGVVTRGEELLLRLRLGGWQDFMGFIDLGGERVLVPADNVVFGPTRTVGSTMIVLADDLSVLLGAR